MVQWNAGFLVILWKYVGAWWRSSGCGVHVGTVELHGVVVGTICNKVSGVRLGRYGGATLKFHGGLVAVWCMVHGEVCC